MLLSRGSGWVTALLFLQACGGGGSSTVAEAPQSVDPPAGHASDAPLESDDPEPDPPSEAPDPPAEEPDPPSSDPLPPELRFRISQPVVDAGGRVTLTWRAEHVDACTASGGWSGRFEPSGSIRIGPIEGRTTFTLSCRGDGGNIVEALSVAVRREVTLAWVPPARNVDGSELMDLAGYSIYYGAVAGAYTDSIHLADATLERHSWTLESGTYFVTMTAVDVDGNESSYSNEVMRTVD